LEGKIEMRPHSNSSAVSWLVVTSLGALLLGSCSDDPAPTAATGNGGSSNGGSGVSAGTSAGGKTAGSSSVGAAGNESAGTSPGGKAGGGGTPNGGSASGSGGTGGSSSGGGNGGSGGAERVYTIEGCEERGAGGADSTAEANIGGEGNVGGESNVGGEGNIGGVGNAGGEGNAGGNAGAPVGGAGEGGAGPIIPAISASFTVYDFVTDRPVQTCVDRVDDFDITITGDAPLTVAANLPPGLMPGSVGWTYDGVDLMPHSAFPYSLGPDDNGDYQEPMPPLTVGEHVLSITVYAEPGGMGGVLGQASITIRVIEG
jgi:hypothetical protein